MNKVLASLVCAAAVAVSGVSAAFAATELEKNFIDAYKKAYESKDEAALKSLLYTKGADPSILEFYTMMMTPEAGAKLAAIELRDLTPEEVKKAGEILPTPDGGNAKLPVAPSKKLVLKTETSGPSGSSTATSESFVAEVDGKLLIPVPALVK